MRRSMLAVFAATAFLAACQSSTNPNGIPVPQDTPQTVYALDATYQAAEKAALVYIQAPNPDKTIVGQIKYYGDAAHDALKAASVAIAANNGTSAAALQAAQAAISAFSNYLIQHGLTP